MPLFHVLVLQLGSENLALRTKTKVMNNAMLWWKLWRDKIMNKNEARYCSTKHTSNLTSFVNKSVSVIFYK